MNYILILDFNTFVSKTIAKLLRNNNIYTIILNGNTPADKTIDPNCKGIIICGDYAGSVAGLELDKAWLSFDIPILALGSCAVAVNIMLGGQTSDEIISNKIEDIHYYDDDYSVLKKNTHAAVHAKELFPAEKMIPFAYINDNVCIEVKHEQKEIFCIQRSFERNDPYSIEMISGFAKEICNCAADWDLDEFVEETIAKIKEKYNNYDVICAVSGGLDSAVCSYIFKQALGNAVKCVFINTGFLRVNEEQEIVDFYKNIIKLDIDYIDAKDEFFNAIADVSDNILKIKIVRDLLSQTIMGRIVNPDNTLLVLGSNYNESLLHNPGLDLSKNINVRYEIVYPLKNLFKFEIKQIAKKFMLPESIYSKPFPSAGLATSIIGKVNSARLDMIKRIYEIYSNEITSSNLDKKISNYGAKLLPFRNLENIYEVHLNAIQDTQSLVSYAFRMPFDLLERVTDEILKEYPNIVRHVLYEVTPYEATSYLD